MTFSSDGTAPIPASPWELDVTRLLSRKNEAGWFELAYSTSNFVAGDLSREERTIPDIIFALSKDGQPLEKFQIYRLPADKKVGEETLVSDDDLILGIQARNRGGSADPHYGRRTETRVVGIREADHCT